MLREILFDLLIGRLKLLCNFGLVDATQSDGLLELYLELRRAVALHPCGLRLLREHRHRGPLLTELLLDLVCDLLTFGDEVQFL